MHKHRCYQMTTNQAACDVIGYLMVRGGVHQAAYALALRKITGVEEVWSGPADWAGGEELEVVTGGPDYGAQGPVVGECRSLFSPDYAPEEIYDIAAQLMEKAGISPLQPDHGLHSRCQGSEPDSPGASAQKGRTSKPHTEKK